MTKTIIKSDLPPNQIIFFGKYPNDKEEMMRISKDGFYWKGEII